MAISEQSECICLYSKSLQWLRVHEIELRTRYLTLVNLAVTRLPG